MRRSSHADGIAVLLWAAMIFAFSSVPDLQSGLSQDFLIRKFAHMAEFGILNVLLVRWLRHQTIGAVGPYGAGFILALFYALSDEIHQGFIPGRESSLRDIGVDTLGMIVALSLMMIRPVRARLVDHPPTTS